MQPHAFHARVSVCRESHAKTDISFGRSRGSPLLLRQSVTLTGFNSQAFEKILDSCATVYAMFSRFMPQGVLLPYSQSVVNVNGDVFSSLCAVTPVFTKRSSDGVTTATREVSISSEMDPQDIANRIKKGHLYLEDNVVAVYEAGKNGFVADAVLYMVTIKLIIEVECEEPALEPFEKAIL